MDIKHGFSKQLTKINMKTSTFLEETKIKTYITTLENEIKELKQKVGELSYEMWKQGEFGGENLVAIFEEIQVKYNTIEEQEHLREEMGEKNKLVLGVGENPIKGPDSDQVFCSNCGESYPPMVNFCKKCGTKLHE